MRKKTYQQLQTELVHKDKSRQNLKKRIDYLKTELETYKKIDRQLVVQYERVVRDWRTRYEYLIHNGWKIVLVKLLIKCNYLRI